LNGQLIAARGPSTTANGLKWLIKIHCQPTDAEMARMRRNAVCEWCLNP